MSPHTITINSAPAASLTSLIVITWSDGAPLNVGSVENEYCVLATQTGYFPYPFSCNSAICFFDLCWR